MDTTTSQEEVPPLSKVTIVDFMCEPRVALKTKHGMIVQWREGVYRQGWHGKWESDCHLIFPEIANFFGTEAGNTLAALGNIHEGDIHILR